MLATKLNPQKVIAVVRVSKNEGADYISKVYLLPNHTLHIIMHTNLHAALM